MRNVAITWGKTMRLRHSSAGLKPGPVGQAMAGMVSGRDGDGSKSLVSCFPFAAKTGERSVGTVHFPIDTYVQHDAEARLRIETYLSTVAASTAARQRYARMAAAVRSRPLDRGRGMHSWIRLKQRASGGGGGGATLTSVFTWA